MVLQLFICLLALAAASLLVTQGRRRRIWSVLILAGLGILAYFFMDSVDNSQVHSFIYQWLPYDILKADISISSSWPLRRMFLPLICLLVGLVYLNTLFPPERYSLHFNTLMLLNFISLILLASSHDFLQLMFAGCMFSLIGFYMPDLILAKKKIFIFNFLSEMALFMALAIVYSCIGSVSLASLPEYAASGRHKDLTAFLLLFAVGSKCGLFLLNGHYFNLKEIAFNRVVCMMSLSVPLSGIIIADKLRLLWTASELAGTVLPWWTGISVVVGLVTAVVNNNLKSKFISQSLACSAFMLASVSADSHSLFGLVPQILILNTLSSSAFIMAANAASEESDTAYLGGFWRCTKGNFILTLLIAASLAAGFASCCGARAESISFAASYLVVFAINMKMIYLNKPRADEKVMAFAKNAGLLYWLPITGVAVWSFWQAEIWRNMPASALLGWFAVVFLFFPVLWLIRLGKRRIWQTDILSAIYEKVVIWPLQSAGRVLWLVFDIVVIERSVIGTVSGAAAVLFAGVRKLQEPRILNYVLNIVAGLAFMLIYLEFYAHE